jgi:peptide/nickel transport system ATP-binding protein
VRLEIRDLTVTFGERVVARVDELVVESGGSVGIAGESGSGKSMTAMAILGMADRLGARVGGSVRLDGEELVGARESRLRTIRGRRIGMIFQSPSTAFNPVLRIGHTFLRALALHDTGSRRQQQARAVEALSTVRLGARVLDRYPNELSGGELQRVAIAISLALRSELLLADEPTSALDVTVQAEILELIASIRERERLALVLISHDLAVVAENTDTLLVMRAGRVVESGPTASVVVAPRDDYTKALFAAVPVLDAEAPG